jgi:hypothetical protein
MRAKVPRKWFIQDLATLQREDRDVKLWCLNDLDTHTSFPESLPPKIYVVENRQGEIFLLSRMIAGGQAFSLLERITGLMIKALKDMILRWYGRGLRLRQVVIPWGGYPMNVQNHIQSLMPSKMLSIVPTTIAKLQRYYDKTEKRYKNQLLGFVGDTEFDEDILLVGDTATASGSTAEETIRLITEGNKKWGIRGHTFKTVLFLTICGSREGLVRPYNLCRRYGIEFIPVFSNSIFQVTRDANVLPSLPGMTDLPFFNEETLTTPGLFKEAQRVYEGKKMCAVGDTGNRLRKISLYLLETLTEIDILQMPLAEPEWRTARELFANPHNREQVNAFRKALESADRRGTSLSSAEMGSYSIDLSGLDAEGKTSKGPK